MMPLFYTGSDLDFRVFHKLRTETENRDLTPDSELGGTCGKRENRDLTPAQRVRGAGSACLCDRLGVDLHARGHNRGHDWRDPAETCQMTIESQQCPGDTAAGQPLVGLEQLAEQLLLGQRRRVDREMLRVGARGQG